MSDKAATFVEQFRRLGERDQRRVRIRPPGGEDPIAAVARDRCAEIEAGTARTIPHVDVQRSAREQIEAFRERLAER